MQFISEQEVAQTTRKFRISEEKKPQTPWEVAQLIDSPLGVQKFSNPSQLLGTCAVESCDETAVEWHHVKRLNRRFKGNIISITDVKGNKLKAKQAYESALARKQIPLCKKHHKEIHSGNIKLNELAKIYIHKESFIYNKDIKEKE
jgi:hypothetical protein